MADIVLDTNILTDLLAQYYEGRVREKGYFESKGKLNKDLARRLNRILEWYVGDDDSPYPGLIVASSIAFVEIARKFNEIADGRFTITQFAAFIEQPPEWFIIAAIDSALFPHLSSLPREILLSDGRAKPIEWADAIHIATAMSRDQPCLLATTDTSIKEVRFLKDKII